MKLLNQWKPLNEFLKKVGAILLSVEAQSGVPQLFTRKL